MKQISFVGAVTVFGDDWYRSDMRFRLARDEHIRASAFEDHVTTCIRCKQNYLCSEASALLEKLL